MSALLGGIGMVTSWRLGFVVLGPRGRDVTGLEVDGCSVHTYTGGRDVVVISVPESRV